MRQKLFTIALAFTSVFATAQITVTDADILNVGDVIFEATDTVSVAVNPGNSGANQTWNFSNLSTNILDTISVLNPSNTPHGMVHPSADVSILMDTNFLYLSKTNNELSLVGVNNVPIYSQFSPLPLNYGFQSSSSYTSLDSLVGIPTSLCQLYLGVPCDSVYFKQVSSVAWNVDAFGDVILPSGTYSSLRLKKIELGIDSVYVHVNGVWYADTANSGVVDTSLEYTWWTNDVSMYFRILEIDYTNNTTNDVVFLTQPQVSSVINLSAENFNVYPIPATDFLTVEAENNELTILNLVDLNGKLILNKQFNTSTNLDLSYLAKGIYYLNLNTDEGKLTKKIVIE
jgi:hypothetical protein